MTENTTVTLKGHFDQRIIAVVCKGLFRAFSNKRLNLKLNQLALNRKYSSTVVLLLPMTVRRKKEKFVAASLVCRTVAAVTLY